MPIYKDECIFTFDNQFSPDGIDVCLTCFIGTSPSPEHNFTAEHMRLSGHTAFLNCKKIKLDPETSKAQGIDSGTRASNEHQPKKLHVKATVSDENVQQITQFKSLGNDVRADWESAIAKVINSESAAQAQQTEEWVLELQPCEHVAIHESVFADKPAQRKSSKELSKCSQCELTSNLWLCLACGNLGCGRPQFDGSGGNGHALAHYHSNLEHALAVKLGSITPEGHVDVYCYSCNDDTIDPQIAAHLAHWGIDIAQQKKTEKSMTELQLEQNMNWDFTGSDGGEPVHGSGLTGLKNLGNSCYVNSVLQSLFGIPEFAEYFHPNTTSSCPKSAADVPQDLYLQLRKLRHGLESGRYDVIAPQMFKALVGKGHKEFATSRQQDAFEYLTFLLSQISKIKEIGDVPAEIFGFSTERRIACTTCQSVRYIIEPQENISISVPIETTSSSDTDVEVFRSVEFSELLDIFTNEEEVESQCPKCKQTKAISSVKFKTFPKVFVVNVRRFRIVNWVPAKVDVPVIVPSKLQLDKYISLGPQLHENVIDNNEIDKPKFEPNEETVAMLQSMGFENDQCIAGLRTAKERNIPDSDIETIINMIISGDINSSNSAADDGNVNGYVTDEGVAMLQSMGFDIDQCKASLKHNNGNVEAAVEWLFSGQYEESRDQSNMNKAPETLRGDATLPVNYELSSIICHKGASVHVGHYVAAIRKGGEMFLFNDERVTKGSDSDELQKFAYIYMFRRV